MGTCALAVEPSGNWQSHDTRAKRTDENVNRKTRVKKTKRNLASAVTYPQTDFLHIKIGIQSATAQQLVSRQWLQYRRVANISPLGEWNSIRLSVGGCARMAKLLQYSFNPHGKLLAADVIMTTELDSNILYILFMCHRQALRTHSQAQTMSTHHHTRLACLVLPST